MKKFKSIWAFVMMLMMTLSFTSCDKDSDIAYTLDGTWSGYMQLRHYYDGTWYDTYTAKVYFNTTGWSSGTGMWQDIYSTYLKPTQAIRWSVNNGNIYIDFQESGEKAIISRYSLDDEYFSGVIQFYSSYYPNGGVSTSYEFQFVKVGSIDWSGYSYYYGAKANNGTGTEWGAKSSISADSTQTAQQNDSLEMIKRAPGEK